MTNSSKKNRIIFIDLLRAFAVLMMVQGHTVDVLLAPEYRQADYPAYAVWHFMRGMTAPIFLFTSGVVFTYLFRLVKEPFDQNPRVKKGFKRFLLLVFLGYLLRYPTPTIVDFSSVSEKSWQIFFAVDVLQLIGFSIFFVLVLSYIADKTGLGDYVTYIIGVLFFFSLYPFFESIQWKDFLPAPVAGYLYKGTGSNFPLFPWAGYCITGAVMGSYLAKKPDVFRSSRFSISIALIGLAFLILAYFGNMIEEMLTGKSYFWTTSPNLIFLRVGFVLILTSMISLISLRISSIPKIIILVGRNTLSIYIVHLMILYGSAWNPGINQVFGSTFGVSRTITAAIIMLSLMIGMVVLFNQLKIKNKQLVTQ